MVSVYRPVGYGPQPTSEEKAALVVDAWWAMESDGRRWLLGPDAVHVDLRMHDPDDFPDLDPENHDEPGPDALYCALGPDGLPCAIGTPPESEPSERERLLDAAVAARRRESDPSCSPSAARLARDTFAVAYLDHIIAEEDANAHR